MKISAFVSLVSASLMMFACGGEELPEPVTPVDVEPAPVVEEPAPVVEQPAPDEKDPSRGNLAISDEIRRLCGITDAEAYFAFDSSNVRPNDRTVLKKLADCFTTGAAAGREMRLVGHADPRGDFDYNMVLGEKRADNVKRVIVAEGMEAARAVTSSRGEMEAKGTDEASWSQDRRVDVLLGE